MVFPVGMGFKMKKQIRQKGQVTVEIVLVLVISLAMAQVLRLAIKEKQIVQEFITTPWLVVSGMMESGTWKKKGEAISEHPLSHKKKVVTITAK